MYLKACRRCRVENADKRQTAKPVSRSGLTLRTHTQRETCTDEKLQHAQDTNTIHNAHTTKVTRTPKFPSPLFWDGEKTQTGLLRPPCLSGRRKLTTYADPGFWGRGTRPQSLLTMLRCHAWQKVDPQPDHIYESFPDSLPSATCPASPPPWPGDLPCPA